MDVKNIMKSQGAFSCPRDLSGNGDDLLHFNGVVDVTAGRAEELCSKQVPSHPTDVSTCHTGSCCPNKDSGSPHSRADGQECKNTRLDRPLTTSSLLSEQADTSVGNHTDSENSAAVLEVYAEEVSSVSDDFSDDDLEYFECSDVLTVYEDEMWRKKLQFLLESDDADDLKLSRDCDGCAYFLSEMPSAFRVSDNATPMDPPIGLCQHQSKSRGADGRRDPRMYSQSALQTEMTLPGGHHRDESTFWKDKEKDQAPVASAAFANDHPRSEAETDGSEHLAAGAPAGETERTDPVGCPADGTGQAAGTMTEASTAADVPGESSLLLEEGRRNGPEGHARHAVCTLTESLRRNLLKLLNPLELCRYVSTIGQSFQAAAEGRQCTAPSPSEEGVLSAQIPEETASLRRQAALGATGEAPKNCSWDGSRTRGLSEQNQMPDENIPLGNQGVNLKSVTQNGEKLCMEPRREKEDIFRACESAEKNTDSQSSPPHRGLCEKKEGCHQQVFSGPEIISNGKESGNDISPFPPWDTDSVPDKQERLCAVLSSAKLCDELGEAEKSSGLGIHGSNNPNIPCSLSAASEANPESAPECGEAERRGDAEVSAVHDKLWKLLHEDDSEDRVPFENRGVTSLKTRLTDIEVTELNFVRESCSADPLPVDLLEEPAHHPRAETAPCDVSDILQGAGACESSSTGNICLAQDGVCPDSREMPTVCVSANGVPSGTQGCSEPNPTSTDGNGFAVAWEGKLAGNNASRTREASQTAPSGNLGCPEADMSHGTAGGLLHAEYSISPINESAPGESCHFKDYYPVRELLYSPEEKDISPCENTNQFTHSDNTIHKTSEANLQEKGNHSDLNAPNDTNSDSCHLSKNNFEFCQDFQVVPNAQKCGCVMRSPALIEIHETTTHKNLIQNTPQVTETAKQEGAVPPTPGDPFLRDFYLEVPSCEPRKPGGEQREVCVADERGDEISSHSGVSQGSESLTAAEQHLFFVDSAFKSAEELKIDSSKNPNRASGGVTSANFLLPREAAREERSPLPFLPPLSHSQGLPGESAARSEGETASIQSGVGANGNLTALETSCGASRGLLQRVAGETQGEAALCENEHEVPRAAEPNPGEAETKPPLHTWHAKHTMNISTQQSCPDSIPSSETTEAENSMKSAEDEKEEAVRTAEIAVNGLVNSPPVDSGNKQSLQEQPPRGRTQPLALAWTTRDPFQTNREGSKSCQTPLAAAEPEPIRCKEDAAKSGAKKKLPPATLSKKPRLEERGSVGKDSSSVKKSGKSEGGAVHKEDRKEQRKLVLKKDSKAPRLLKKIQAELFPDFSGNIKLCCQFGDIHADSSVTWTKDSKVLARLQRSAQDDSPVCLAIAKGSYSEQGMYYCCLNNVYGKVTAEFHLTAAALERLSSSQNYEGVEEIEFMELLFREDPLSSSYFGGPLHGAITTEGLHFGEGMHRRAFRSRVLQGLAPTFGPGHPCVLKVHSALTYGTKSREELLQKNYTLALQECYVQNTAREYAKLYAAEAEPLEGFGEVPEIIPIFLIRRPANNIPYATVEEELVGEFVKYSVKDGKEVNFLRRDSEAGQKCCTFQHWVYEKTNGNLLVTDLQGVGMKLTDVGIATLAKGYKGFKGNCPFSFIEQFRALHQCNEYCEMLGLKSLRSSHQKQRKAASVKSKNLPNSSAVKKMVPKKAREPRDFISSEH